MMDWYQFLMIIVSIVGVFWRLSTKMDNGFKDLAAKIQKNREDLLVIKCFLKPNKYHPFSQDEKPQENPEEKKVEEN